LPHGPLRSFVHPLPPRFLIALLCAAILFAAGAALRPGVSLGADTTRAAACSVYMRTQPSETATWRATINADTRVTVTRAVAGAAYSTTCAGRAVSGSTWFLISAINGKTVRSLYGIPYAYGAAGLFKTIPAYVACRVYLRTRPFSNATKKVLITQNTQVTIGMNVPGGAYHAWCNGKILSGVSWLRIDAINGRSIRSLYGIGSVYAPLALFEPTPTAADPTPPPPPASGSCGSSLQGEINAAATGSTLDLSGCTYTTSATVDKALTLKGATIRPPAGSAGLTVTADNVTLDGLTILGQNSRTYDSGEMGIIARGTASNPVANLRIRNTEVGNFGYGGMNLRFVTNLVVQNNDVHDGVYAGIMILSGATGTVSGNTVERIGVYGAAANSNNAYGIALSQQNPATDPPTRDFTVSGNVVTDVPTWHAFDTHGGLRIDWTGNTAKRSRSGFFITGPHPQDNAIDGNRVEAPANADHYAITSVYSTGGEVKNNTIVGWPAGHAILTTSGGDPAATAVNLVISGNTIIP
jgi:Right handed beta helix region